MGRRVDERPPHGHGPGRTGRVAGGTHAAGDAGPPRAGGARGARRAGEHLPPPRAAREGGDRPGPRDGRPVRRRPGRGLVRGRARAVRDPATADRRAHRPPDLRGGGAANPLLAGGGDTARRDPAGPVLPARRRRQRPCAAHRRRPADLPGWAEATRDRIGGAAGRGLAADGRGGWQRRATSATVATRSCGRSRSRAATPRRSRSWARCTPAPTHRRDRWPSRRREHWWLPAPPRWSSGSRRHWARGVSRTRTGTCSAPCEPSSGRHGWAARRSGSSTPRTRRA